MPDDPVYQVRPVLHEPGPINTSWLMSREGIPVHKGEPIRVSGEYDGELPHVKVMSVMHIYMAKANNVPAAKCPPMPADMTNENIDVPGRAVAPVITIPLTGLTPEGKTVSIDRPPGDDQVFDGNTSVRVHDFSFSKANLSVPLGASITWKFPDSIAHDVTTANGPLAFSSPFSRLGRTYTQKFKRPGTYRLFCSLHPVVMHEVVDVRDPGSGGAAGGSSGSDGSGGAAPKQGPGGANARKQRVIHW
jgi:plastocyanin